MLRTGVSRKILSKRHAIKEAQLTPGPLSARTHRQRLPYLPADGLLPPKAGAQRMPSHVRPARWLAETGAVRRHDPPLCPMLIGRPGAPRGRFELPKCEAPPALKAGAVIRAWLPRPGAPRSVGSLILFGQATFSSLPAVTASRSSSKAAMGYPSSKPVITWGCISPKVPMTSSPTTTSAPRPSR